MMRLGSSELYFHEFNPIDSILRQIDEVSRDQVQEIARNLFREKGLSKVIIQPEEMRAKAM
jgi:predicted Zn-dependent peptidase